MAASGKNKSLKRTNNRGRSSSQTQPKKRARTVRGSIGNRKRKTRAPSTPQRTPTIKKNQSAFASPSVKLEKDRIYKFYCTAVGSFRIKGGATGDVTIGGFKVTISNHRGKTVFSYGGPNYNVKLKTNGKDKTTTVSLISGAVKTKTQHRSNTLRVSGSTRGQGIIKQVSPMNIVARKNESIVIWGNSDYVVTGDGGYIRVSGSADVVVYGSPQSVTVSGSGDITVHGDVTGSVSLSGSGNVVINGDVDGRVSLAGSGDIDIYGDVGSSVSLVGSGDIYVDGEVWGNVSQVGSGDVIVRGNGY